MLSGWLADVVCGLDRALAILAALTAAVLAATALQGPGWPHWSVGALAVALGLSVMAWTGLYLAAAVAAAPFEASAVSAGAMLFTFAGVALALALLATRRRPAEDVCHDDAPDPPPSR